MNDHPCIFGEVLFDCFPTGERILGGAPFNVAWHLQAFGASPRFISRVGNDTDGNAILDAMMKWGMRTDGVQIDERLPTGRVDVAFGELGEPSYDIVHPSAWDAIATDQAASPCGLIYHGSLALRDQASSDALQRLKGQRGNASVFVDVNLRPPWWRKEQVEGLLQGASWVKLNAEELALLEPSCNAADVVARYRLHGLILTHGEDGAEIVTSDAEAMRVKPGKSVQVVDTVGAGDAFASVMLLGLIRAWPLAVTVDRAQGFASRVVGQRGATVRDVDFYRDIMADWNADQAQECFNV